MNEFKESVVNKIISYVTEMAKYHAELHTYLQDKEEFHKNFAIDLYSQLLGELCDLKETCMECGNDFCDSDDAEPEELG